MVEMLRTNYRKFDDFLRGKPGYSVIILFVFLAIIQLTINLIRHAQPFANFYYPLLFSWFHLISYFAFVITSRKGLQFLVCFLLIFLTLLTIDIIEESLVDYTSVILIAFISIFGGFGPLLGAINMTKRKKELEISNDE